MGTRTGLTTGKDVAERDTFVCEVAKTDDDAMPDQF
jgi:hypothetical protein